MPSAFYGSLAASASIFIGIITALLVNNISQNRSELDLISRQITTINSRRQNMKSEIDNYDNMFDGVRSSNSTPALIAQTETLTGKITKKSEMESLRDKGEYLKDKGESIDLVHAVNTLRVCVYTIILSVIVPSTAMLFHTLGISLSIIPLFGEVGLIFLSWLIGLGLVFLHLEAIISNINTDIPDLVSVDGDESGGRDS